MFEPESWRQLNFFAKVQPQAIILPARASYNDLDEENTNIGINPLAVKTPIWFSAADLVASAILTGRPPKVLEAIRLTPVGIQKGLETITLDGKTINPERDNFYRAIIKGKEQSSGAIREFYKCVANSCYGITVEVNGKQFAKNKKKKVRVFSGDFEFNLTNNKAELPGQWYCPFIGSWVTAGGRLLVAMLEKTVTNTGGSYLMSDTDSMAILSTQNGGLVPCGGGEHKLSDGRDAALALPWSQVEAVCEKFNRLNPHDSDVVKQFLKIEDCNYARAFDKDRKEVKGAQQQLYGYAISSKRYCLFTEREIIKPSEHALGVYFVPDKRERHKPSHFKAHSYPRWIVEAWQWILGFTDQDPDWFNIRSMRKLAITTPRILGNLRSLDRDAARAYNFVISPVLPLSKAMFITSYCDDPALWESREYVCAETGEKGKLDDFAQLVDGIIAPLGKQVMGDVIRKYTERPEFKFLAVDGLACTKDTCGLLRRRPVLANSVLQFIGKEVDRGTSEDAFMMNGEKLMRYADSQSKQLPKGLGKHSDREIANSTGLDTETVARMRKGKKVRRRTYAKLAGLHRHSRHF